MNPVGSRCAGQRQFRLSVQTGFSDISLDVVSGELLCLLGPNGCGKTTLLRCLGGALHPARGRVVLDGVDLSTLSVDAIARRVGFVFQEHTPPFPFPVIEIVRMGRAPHLGFLSAPSRSDTRLADEALELVGMQHVRNKPYTQLSGGERQLVADRADARPAAGR